MDRDRDLLPAFELYLVLRALPLARCRAGVRPPWLPGRLLPHRALVGEGGGRRRTADARGTRATQGVGLCGLRLQPRFGADCARVDTRRSAGVRPFDGCRHSLAGLVRPVAPPVRYVDNDLKPDVTFGTC